MDWAKWDGVEQCGAELDNVAHGLDPGPGLHVNPEFLRRVANYVRALEANVKQLKAMYIDLETD